MKLYGLYVVDNESSLERLVCASNETAKLRSVGFSNMWRTINDPNDNTLRSEGEIIKGSEYPKYVIRELCYIV